MFDLQGVLSAVETIVLSIIEDAMVSTRSRNDSSKKRRREPATKRKVPEAAPSSKPVRVQPQAPQVTRQCASDGIADHSSTAMPGLSRNRLSWHAADDEGTQAAEEVCRGGQHTRRQANAPSGRRQSRTRSRDPAEGHEVTARGGFWGSRCKAEKAPSKAASQGNYRCSHTEASAHCSRARTTKACGARAAPCHSKGECQRRRVGRRAVQGVLD